MTRIALLVAVVMLLSACGTSSVYAPTSTPLPTQIVASASATAASRMTAGVTPPPAPQHPIADRAVYEPLVRNFVSALQRQDDRALSALFNSGLLVAGWCLGGHGVLTGSSSATRFVADPRLRPVAIVEWDRSPGAFGAQCMRATGVLVENWDDRVLEIDASPDNPALPRNVGQWPLSQFSQWFQSRPDSVVLIFHTESRGTPGRLFGLAPARGWTKVADLP